MSQGAPLSGPVEGRGRRLDEQEDVSPSPHNRRVTEKEENVLSTRKLASTVLGAFLALTMAAAPVDAQEAVTLDFAGGVGIPGGDLADFQDIGPAFDIGLDVRVHPRFSLRASGGAEIFSGTEIENAFDASIAEQGFVDFSTVHFNGGGVVHAVNEGPLRVDFNGGAGVTILTSERGEFSGAGDDATLVEIVDLSETYLNVTAGLDIGYMVSEQVELFVGGDGHLFFMDEDGENESALNNIAPDLSAPSTGWTVPVAAGVRFHFQP